jgi:predicted DNA-binding transcriptional regulator YafY
MRADRLLSILLLLQVHRRITAGELARRLEVSERTIHRDMEALGIAGIPVFAERGIGGGWSLLEEYRTNLTGLNKAEIQALFLAGPSRLLADLGLEKASDAALIKLLAALPSCNRGDAEYIRQRIHIDITGWNRPDESFPFLPTIQEAIWRERKLLMTYERGGGCDPVERLVDPLGLVAKGSVWYLVAAVDGENRSYRVSRVRGAVPTGEPLERPAGFDLAAYWQQSAAVFKAHLPQYQALLRVAGDVLPRLGYAGRFARIEHIDPPAEDGWSEVRMRFQFEQEACEYVLSFGDRVMALAPETLREKVVTMAQSVIAFNTQSSPARSTDTKETMGSSDSGGLS